MRRTKQITVPGQQVGLTVPLAAVTACPAPAPCAPDPTGLYWFSDATGDFTEIAEAAYVLPVSTDPEKPTDTVAATLGVARVLGETCNAVTWTASWTPETASGGAPGWNEDGPELQVYPLPDTAPGVLSVYAACSGRTLGPITLTLALLDCGTGACTPEIFGLCIFTQPLI